MKDWLWVEDQPSTIETLRIILRDHLKLKIEVFQNPSELLNNLIDRKKKNHQMNNIGLILDVMLTAQPYIICPKEWSGTDVQYFKTINNGYDAGLVFYEKLVMGMGMNEPVKPLWDPPPPVIFLTVLHTDTENIDKRIGLLKAEWSRVQGIEPGDSKIEWIRKWDANGESMRQLLTQWREL